MVRIGGINYACTPAERIGHRISDMTLNEGTLVEAGKSYRVAGWASVNPQTGKPVADVVADYLRAKKVVTLAHANRACSRAWPMNPGYAAGGSSR